MNARQARWLAFLSEYNFEIKHIKGKENKVADALRRNANLNCLSSVSSYKTKLYDKFEYGVKMDKDYQKLREKVTGNEFKNLKTDFSLNEKGLMLYKNMLYVPEIKLLILNEVHKSTYSRHLGYEKMITMLRKYYFWANMKNEVSEYIARCIEFQQVEDENRHPEG